MQPEFWTFVHLHFDMLFSYVITYDFSMGILSDFVHWTECSGNKSELGGQAGYLVNACLMYCRS